MKAKTVLLLVSLSLGGLTYSSCNQNSQDDKKNTFKETGVWFKDYGAEPLVLNIEDYTSANENFRTTLWTGGQLQVTLMSIPVGGDVGLEQHSETDQFLRIEDGKAKIMLGDSEDSLDFVETAGEDFAIFIPAGKWHNITNIGDKPLKLYSIYSPVEHPHGTVHKTQKESIEAHNH